jgi:hypothetical protein
MTRSIFKHIFPVIPVFILIAACAKVSSPTGGPRDKEPPHVVKSIPVNGAINFREKKIAITFNEYVVLDKITDKFMVSPPMNKKPRIFLRGKSVIIEYEDKLRDSTTYTFYFQDAIRDLNEGNPIENYQFVFSTGSVIDSLSVTGNVYNALNLDPPEATLVLLHKDLADSAVIKKLPDYISKVDKKGYFRIDNVKGGTYRLYALKDADNSKNFNLADEEMGFMNSPVEITAEKNYTPVKPDTIKIKPGKVKAVDTVIIKGEYKLILFQSPKKNHYLTSSSRSMPYKLTYTLSLPPDSLGFDFSIPGTDRNSYFMEKSRENDTILIWMTDTALYSRPQIITLFTYPFTDTTGNLIRKQDTIQMRFVIPRSPRVRAKPAPFRVTSNISSGSIKPGWQIVFKSQTPFRAPDTSRIRLYVIEEKNRTKMPFSFIRDSLNSCRLTLDVQPEKGKSYLFIADLAAFGNIYGEQSDSTGTRFVVRDEKTFGSILINIKNYVGDRIIQLLSADGKLTGEKKMQKDGKVEFKYIDQGKYRLRVIYDLNGDGKWTSGDFITGRQPEPVSYYNQELYIKEGWVEDQDWDISEQNIKKIINTSAVSRTNNQN